jgi:hypothetical protein
VVNVVKPFFGRLNRILLIGMSFPGDLLLDLEKSLRRGCTVLGQKLVSPLIGRAHVVVTYLLIQDLNTTVVKIDYPLSLGGLCGVCLLRKGSFECVA